MVDPTDYAEIAQLLARYCLIVDAKEWDRLGEIFAEDGSMTVEGRWGTHTGPAELRELYAEKMNHPVAHHSTTVEVLDAAGEAAHARSKWLTVGRDGAPGTGVYHDTLTRTPAGWRIVERFAVPDPR